ncbi:MFS transporter [Nesterenkonia sandarakina]|uniref:MFS family permease n=1 Tax=Nesterenkonia sandarakina TaxID=272918 RepID=A0A7Z0J473_9MICC|nr:MFS transporter [Nesterenkonia sandarakina]NYJ17751.1 MFS family permease [Nesterenkonia sandarakina]
MRLRHNSAFVRFWFASTVSDFGTYITTVALSVLVLVSLGGTAFDQGLVNAARWAPYVFFGLLAGIWVDRLRRRTVLIASDFGRGLVLSALCLLGVLGLLELGTVMVLIFCFGTLALMSDAAYQSFLPQLVPRPLLTRANARLQQSDTVAQTSGSAVAGGLVALVTAPFALLLGAITHFGSATVLLTLRQVAAEKPPAATPTSIRRKVSEGLSWIYRHPRLGPLAWSSHAWFVGSAMMGAVLPALILNDLGLGALGLGLVLTAGGIGSVIGTLLSVWIGERWGTGRTMVISRFVQPAALALVALAPLAGAAMLDGPLVEGAYASPADWPPARWLAFGVIAAAQFVFWVAMGIEGPLEMGYWQAVTPDRLLARMSATRRSINRGMIVLGAPLGGALAIATSSTIALLSAAGVMLLAVLALVISGFLGASVEADQLTDDEALA